MTIAASSGNTITGNLSAGNPSAGHLEILRVLGRSENADSVVDEILVAVGTAIVEARLKPGDDLNSVELARMFSSSRTPVREIHELRATLYALVSRRIVEIATENDMALLRENQHQLEQAATAGDADRYFWQNVAFRNNEAMVAGNETVRRVLDSVGVRTLQLRHLSLDVLRRHRQSQVVQSPVGTFTI